MLVSIFVHKDRLPYVKEALSHHEELVISEVNENENHRVDFDCSEYDVQFLFHAGVHYGLDVMANRLKADPVF